MELCRTAGEAVLIIIGAATIAKSLFRSLVRRIADRGELLLASAAVTLIPAVFVFVIGQEELERGIIASALKE